MKRSFLTKLTGMAVAVSFLAAATACSSQDASSNADSQGNAPTSSEIDNEAGTIKVSMGRQTLQNVTFPDGDTYEDNAYIRMAEKNLKITENEKYTL